MVDMAAAAAAAVEDGGDGSIGGNTIDVEASPSTTPQRHMSTSLSKVHTWGVTNEPNGTTRTEDSDSSK